MSYLFDTNIISELRKGKSCDPGVRRWHGKVAEADIYVSALVLGEIRKGIEKLRLRDPGQARALEDWLAALTMALGRRVLLVTAVIAEEWGRMSAARDVPVIDSLLAATARVHGLTVVTRNTRDFDGLGVPLLNPFDL